MTVAPSCDTLCRRIGNAKLDIEELRTFVEVADAGGVSPAALPARHRQVDRQPAARPAGSGTWRPASRTNDPRRRAHGSRGHVPRLCGQSLRRDRRGQGDDPARRRAARPPAHCRAAVFRPDPLRPRACGDGAAPPAAPHSHLLQRSLRRSHRRGLSIARSGSATSRTPT